MPDPSTTPSHPHEPGKVNGSGGPPQPDPTLAYEPPTAGPVPANPEPGYATYGYPVTGFPPTSSYQAPPQLPGQYAAAPAGCATTPPGTAAPGECNWAATAHVSGLVTAYFALGFLGPLIILLTVGKRSPFIRQHAVEALNFNLTTLIAVIASLFLILVLVGFLMLPLIALGYLITTIMGAAAASQGRDFQYPLTIRFVH